MYKHDKLKSRWEIPYLRKKLVKENVENIIILLAAVGVIKVIVSLAI